MARIVTGPEASTIADARATYSLRVECEDPDGVYQDVSSLLGVDWLNGCVINQDQDAPVMSARISLARGHGLSLSTAPLMQGSLVNRNAANSYAEFFRPGIGVRIYAAVTVGGAAPSVGDWKLMFRGEADDASISETEVVLDCRGPGGGLVDRFIETEGNLYGSTPTPTAMEVVLQEIIDDHAPGHTVVTPVSPGFGILEYEQERMTVADATVQAIALELIGWDLRYRYSDGAADFTLQLRDPERSKTTPDFTFPPTSYFSVPVSRMSRRDVRNAIEVSYVDAADSTRKIATYTNAASIAKYDRRWLGIRLGAGHQINSPSEAQALADAVGSDLSELPISHSIDAAFHWGVQLGDLIRLPDDGVHHDTDLDLAVFRVTHSFSKGTARTLLDMRGRPAAASDNWRGLFPEEDTAEAYPVLTAGTDEDANVVATVLMPPPWQSIRILADLTDYEDLATTEATGTIVDLVGGAVHILPEDVEAAKGGPLETMDAANPQGFVSVVGYKGPGATGEKSPLLRDKTSIAAIPDGSITGAKIAIQAIVDANIAAAGLSAASLQTGLQSWSSTLEVLAIADDQIQWHGPGGPGNNATLKLKDGTSYTINHVASQLLADDAIRYVYFDPASPTDLQVTTDYNVLADSSRLLICWAKKGAFGNAVATVVPSPGAAGLPQIGFDALMVGSVGEGQLRAASVIAGKLAANSVAASNIIAGNVTAAAIGASQINAIHINANAITSSAIQADAILAVHIATGVLSADNIEAGTISASVVIASSQLTASAVTIDGSVTIKAGGGVARFILDGTSLRAFSAGGAQLWSLLSTGSVLNGVGGFTINAGGDLILNPGGGDVRIFKSSQTGKTAQNIYVPIKYGPTGSSTGFIRIHT